jgi:DNA-binding LacI/PurR family transcriptional regulator
MTLRTTPGCPATVLLPRYELGTVAVALLLERIAHPRRPLPARALPTRLDPGASTAHPATR